ncbi:type IV toxin-antitoxin system AbiEi family antitoxin domain-containing protein [Hymenobacter psychrophilus]|uniref:Uncharacterized protein n=1 Tax=Hymenobacter psychrophilus TaxID=651662 RepID=A0A1H3NZN8_9BACT|nr:hypothetical protein [Hymenobacter psychrophilus]SDY94231.1 Domain of unknown function [Hymenobacter psychrophilus]
MPGKSRFSIAEARIRAFFKQSPTKVFTKVDLVGVLEEYRSTWNLALATNDKKFTDLLVKREILRKVQIDFDGYVPSKDLYVSDDAPVYQIAAASVHKSYLSHYSAVWLNGLTTQVPKIIFVTFEQSKKHNIYRELEQDAIDRAFSRPQRRSGSIADYSDYAFVALNGSFTNRSGVTTINNVPVTNIERTLIDITVRPNYAGGVHAVLDAYKNAMNRISINKLIATLDNINFIYPYFQAVGFYLEKAGYKGKKIDELKARKKVFNFYLTYEIEVKDYSPEWMLYFPKGL